MTNPFPTRHSLHSHNCCISQFLLRKKRMTTMINKQYRYIFFLLASQEDSPQFSPSAPSLTLLLPGSVDSLLYKHGSTSSPDVVMQSEYLLFNRNLEVSLTPQRRFTFPPDRPFAFHTVGVFEGEHKGNHTSHGRFVWFVKYKTSSQKCVGKMQSECNLGTKVLNRFWEKKNPSWFEIIWWNARL